MGRRDENLILYILACMKIKMKEDDNYGVKHCSFGNNK